MHPPLIGIWILNGEALAKGMTISSPQKISIIQYGYMKWGINARVLSQILAQGNNKNEGKEDNGKK